MRDSIVEEIRTTVNGKAKAAGFALVIDITADSALGTPVVLYANNENDLTAPALAQLNAGAPAETPKSEAKKADKPDEKKKDKK